MRNLKTYRLDGVQRNIDLIDKLFPNAISNGNKLLHWKTKSEKRQPKKKFVLV